ncbi:hypothetical protein GWK47_029140 [Chionoecetes opilio]|uniref:Uncharacterized protein n=1 Tax=Chionoecetes opilio TaxID=41210 RepID=A0A8J5CRN8_CHIOP|nr:hypothetical protein GWK47_029140 [Chionoecetes opilio]
MSSSPDKGTLPENSATEKAESGRRDDDSEPVEERTQNKGLEEEPQPRRSPMNNGMDPAQALHTPVDSIPSEVHFFKTYGSTTEESQGKEENRGSPNETEPGPGIPEPLMNGVATEEECSGREAPAAPPFRGGAGPVPVQAQNSERPEPGPRLGREHQGEEEKLEHMQSVADDLVAKLVEEDDPRPRSNTSNPGVTPPGQMGPLPEPPPHPTHTSGDEKWYYTDPQVSFFFFPPK